MQILNLVEDSLNFPQQLRSENKGATDVIVNMIKRDARLWFPYNGVEFTVKDAKKSFSKHFQLFIEDV